MTARYLEIIFADHISPGDLEIIQAATAGEPGRARLLAAIVEPAPGGDRILSANGRNLIAVSPYAERPLPPFSDCYWLEVGPESAGDVGAGSPKQEVFELKTIISPEN